MNAITPRFTMMAAKWTPVALAGVMQAQRRRQAIEVLEDKARPVTLPRYSFIASADATIARVDARLRELRGQR